MARTKWVEIVNRTTGPLDVMFDGVPDVIPPGYKVEGEGKDTKIVGAGRDGKPATFTCELHAAEKFKRQHPIRGTLDPNSVDANDCDYLLGVEAWGDDIEHVEQSDAIEVIDRGELPDDRQNIAVRQIGGGRRTPDKSAKNVRKRKMVERNKRRQAYTDNKLKNPTGIRANYED
jgi:hypothetical protein